MPQLLIPKRRISERFLPHRIVFPAILLSLAVVCAGIVNAQQPQDRMQEYKDKYVKESDPVRKAKALGNYGDAQMQHFVREASAENFDAATALLTAYRNEVRSVFDALKATGVDAEKKPDGFKELEFHLRRTLWQIDRTLPAVPIEHRETLQETHDELGRIHTELIHLLFPREAGKKSGDK
ncbi:MAG TPA: hypothetical protein VIH72_00790 [Candidatus Acidoferrales bacterium]